MPNDLDMPDVFKHVMGVFRFGKGLLGRSSNALICVVILAGIAIWRLHSEISIVGVFAAIVVLFLVWYFRIERFANKHPLEALLEGGEYTAHHQMLIAAKGQPPISLKDAGQPQPGLIESSVTQENQVNV